MKRFFFGHRDGSFFRSCGWVGGLCMALVLLLGPGRARGQFLSESSAAAKALPAGQTVNLFARWEGETPIDGVFIELPAGWSLQRVVALRYGTEAVPVTVRRSRRGGNEYFVGAERTLKSAYEFVFRVQTSSSRGLADWTLVPFTFRKEQQLARLTRYRTSRSVELEATPRSGGNYVLSLEGRRASNGSSQSGPPRDGTRSLLLRRSALPSLSKAAPYTVECWIKSTGLGEVLLSTWDGLESRPYPLELVIDRSGRLRYYHGEPDRHASMVSVRPVADGTWHHVALSNDPDADWTRLLVDGELVDSLQDAPPLENNLDAVAVGGRVPSPREEADVYAWKGFSGLLDELHFWPDVRTPEVVRQTMRQPRQSLPQASEGGGRGEKAGTQPLALRFEEDIPENLLQEPVRGARRVRSDLIFYAPVSDLRARLDDEESSVVLSWSASDKGSFIIERSSDGSTFRPVGEKQARSSQAGEEGYRFVDETASGNVLFYRIRQRFEDGTERLSGALKVGRGRSHQEGATLMGNFPNPFSGSTTIAYRVHEATQIRVEIWDLSGQRVSTLVDQQQEAGYHELLFQPRDLASGTYFIRLYDGSDTHSHKMVLLR